MNFKTIIILFLLGVLTSCSSNKNKKCDKDTPYTTEHGRYVK